MIRLASFTLTISLAFAACAAADYLDIGDTQIYFESHGEGPPVVFVHDGLNHSEIWDGQLAAFSSEYRFVRYDRRGYGRSDTPTEPFSNEDDLLELIDANGIDQAVLVGSSSGGGLAVNFALNHPDRVLALVLVGAVVDGLGFSTHFTRRNMALYGSDEEGRIDRFVADPWAIAPQNTAARERVRELLEAYPNNLADEKFRLARRYANLNPAFELALSRLHEISVPTLIVTGSADIPDVHVHAGALESGIQGAKREVITGVGHLSYLENPEAFNEVVLEFLSLISFGREVQRGFAPVRDTYLYYESIGSGAPLVLLNGGLLDHRMWDDQFDEFAKHFRVIRYDMQTTGLSINLGAYSHSEDLRDLLNYLEIETAHLAGLSGGARAAIDFALDHPARVEGLVLVSPGLNGYEFTGEDYLERSVGMQEAFADGNTVRAVELFQRQWTDGLRNPEEVDTDVRSRVREMLLRNALPGRVMGRLREIQPPAISRLAEIQAPTLVISGALDLSDIHTITDMLNQQVPVVETIEMPDVAHMVNMERPEEFNRVVVDFLTRL